MIPATMQDMDVAIEAPLIPSPRGNTMYQSRNMFSIAATICTLMA